MVIPVVFAPPDVCLFSVKSSLHHLRNKFVIKILRFFHDSQVENFQEKVKHVQTYVRKLPKKILAKQICKGKIIAEDSPRLHPSDDSYRKRINFRLAEWFSTTTADAFAFFLGLHPAIAGLIHFQAKIFVHFVGCQ